MNGVLYTPLSPGSIECLHRDNWAKTVSPNSKVKVYIGAPASSTAAGSGYVSVSTLGSIARQTRSKYSSFGGVMLWDASQAYGMSHRHTATILLCRLPLWLLALLWAHSQWPL